MKTFQAATVIAAVILSASLGHAVDPDVKCQTDKNKVAGKHGQCRHKAEAKFVKGGDAVKLAADIAKCDSKFSDKWTKAEDKAGPGICPSEGDAASIQTFVDYHVDAVADALGGGSLPAVGCGSPNGTKCGDDTHCASGNCFVFEPLGSICSECNEDSDCAVTTGFGCNFGYPQMDVQAECSTTGDIGESCETVDACAPGLFCPTLLLLPGIFQISTCSECEQDTDCGAGEICAPVHNPTALDGFHQCVAAGSRANGEGCVLTGDGSECASGQCAVALLSGISFRGACAECNEDSDCAPGRTCSAPLVEISALTGAVSSVDGQCVD